MRVFFIVANCCVDENGPVFLDAAVAVVDMVEEMDTRTKRGHAREQPVIAECLPA